MARGIAALWPQVSNEACDDSHSAGAADRLAEDPAAAEMRERAAGVGALQSAAGGRAGDGDCMAPGATAGGSALGVVWRQAGATVIVPAGAPDPELHRPRLPEEAIERVLAAKREVRERGIERLLEEMVQAARAGRSPDAMPPDRFIAAIRWDGEFAARTTNRRQLAEIGVEVPRVDELPESDDDVHRALWTMIYGLARLGIFLTETDGTDDRSILALLAGRILEDEVSDIPPNGDMSEFIALCHGTSAGPAVEGSSPPDGLRGPFECDDEDDGSWEAPAAADRKPRGPRRDHLLPRPYRPEMEGPS
jgi:hypothetical protein